MYKNICFGIIEVKKWLVHVSLMGSLSLYNLPFHTRYRFYPGIQFAGYCRGAYLSVRFLISLFKFFFSFFQKSRNFIVNSKRCSNYVDLIIRICVTSVSAGFSCAMAANVIASRHFIVAHIKFYFVQRMLRFVACLFSASPKLEPITHLAFWNSCIRQAWLSRDYCNSWQWELCVRC